MNVDSLYRNDVKLRISSTQKDHGKCGVSARGVYLTTLVFCPTFPLKINQPLNHSQVTQNSLKNDEKLKSHIPYRDILSTITLYES